MLEKYAHVFPAMVTPMNEDGSFNYEVAKKHADWMILADEGATLDQLFRFVPALAKKFKYIIDISEYTKEDYTLNSEEHLLLLDVQERELKMPAR